MHYLTKAHRLLANGKDSPGPERANASPWRRLLALRPLAWRTLGRQLPTRKRVFAREEQWPAGWHEQASWCKCHSSTLAIRLGVARTLRLRILRAALPKFLERAWTAHICRERHFECIATTSQPLHDARSRRTAGTTSPDPPREL